MEEQTRGRAQLRPYVLSAVVSAGVLIFAVAFFMAGFATHALLADDEEGGRPQVVASPGPQAAASPQATPPPVVAASADDDPAWGPADAPVTMIEFSDFQCPFCLRFWSETLPQIRQEYEGKVRFVYRDFPLTTMHEWAQKAAEGAECADDQGKFWEYHDLIFGNQSALNQQLSTEGLDGVLNTFKSFATQLSLDTAAFNDCLDSGKYASEVQKDLQDGTTYGVTGTPSFFINGQNVQGAQPFEAFKSVIDAALAQAEAG